MQISIDAGWAVAVFLVSLRLSFLFLLSPVFSGLAAPVAPRVLLTLALAALLVAGGALRPALPDYTLGSLVQGALGEAVVGITLSFGVFAAFGAFSMAGKLLDIQSGFGIGSVYDPVTRSGAPMFAAILNLVAVALFFALDAHHALMRGIAFSLQQVPPGAGLALPLEAVLAQFGLVFSMGLALVIPVMLCLLLIEIGLAVVSRALPQMNVFVISIPVKLVAGVSIFALCAPALEPAMGRVYASIFTFWERALH
ncbi:flagellar biosynthetic protein FliR [Duganella sp. CF458]|uniref:flagellar biosynthetic protein FliR n=1 Tax=Duganella sp. CF458 TaxID=1884368 RepID=UPI0008E63399|nr:flagellar biosynthetic protein FliR [Duganella sp. CF458]SFG89011.1 flagellar biosynthetic protein FliR [Duganella sp. CF458]